MTRLYNIAVYWPEEIQTCVKKIIDKVDFHVCHYGSHARAESMTDRYGKILLPLHLQIAEKDVFEVELDSFGTLVKFLVRVYLDQTRDLIMVLCPRDEGTLFCRTVWANLRTDKHKSLQKSKYVQENSA